MILVQYKVKMAFTNTLLYFNDMAKYSASDAILESLYPQY
jgi:hypothetical protein